VELFLRLTIFIAVAIAGLVVLAFAVKILVVAAVLAGIGAAGYFLYRTLRPKTGALIVPTPRR
jgi:hypothetical protein